MKTFKLKIYSLGGQGVKSMVSRLEKSLESRQDIFFTSLVKYDGIIKGGMVETNIVISKKKNLSPFIDHATLCVFFTKVQKPVPSDEYIEIAVQKREDYLEREKFVEKKILEFFNNGNRTKNHKKT